MAILGEWQGGSTSLLPGTSWSAPNGLVSGTATRNDSSTYTFNATTSTVGFAGTPDADGYIVLAAFEFDDTSNGRHNPSLRIIQSAGTGDFVGATSSGYNRDSSERYAYVRTFGFVHNPSSSDTFQVQWKRDSDVPTGGTVRAHVQIIPVYYSNHGLYSSATNTMTGGTTPTMVAGFSAVSESDTAAIEISSNVVSVKGGNKRYLVLGGQYWDSGGNARSQRWHGLAVDGTLQNDVRAYSYIRNNGNNNFGDIFTTVVENIGSPNTTTLESQIFRGEAIGTFPNTGGSVDSTTTGSNGNHALVVLELNDTAKVFRGRSNTQQDIDVAGTRVQIDAAATEVINDTDTFVGDGTDEYVMQTATDVLLGANISGGYAANSTQRYTGYSAVTINGTDQEYSISGDYGRGDQGSQDTWGWSSNNLSFHAVSSSDRLGISAGKITGGESGTVDALNGWSGFWGIDLDTLEDAGGPAPITGTLATQEGGADDFTASGVVTDPDLTGTLAAQESGQDGFSGLGSAAATGSLSAQESGTDTLTGSGATPIVGAASAQEAGSDAFSGSGTVAFSGISGSLSAQESGADSFAGAGLVAWPEISGALAAQEAGSDTFAGAGAVGGGGGAPTADFKIIQGSALIPAASTSLTLQDGVDYNLESGIADDAWFFRMVSHHNNSVGNIVAGGAPNSDEVMAYVSAISGGDVTLTKFDTGTNDVLVLYEIIQYIGAAGGDNEIKVRGKGTLSFAQNTDLIQSVAVPGTVANSADVVPWITGQAADESNNNYPHQGFFLGYLNGSNFDFERKEFDRCPAAVSYALVEFTGSNWTVSREAFTGLGFSTGDNTQSITAVSDISKTFLHVQQTQDRVGGTLSIHRGFKRTRLTSTTELTIYTNVTADNEDVFYSVYIIQNPDINVTRYTGEITPFNTIDVTLDVTITAVTQDEASVMVQTDGARSASDYPIANAGAQITSDTNVRLRVNDNAGGVDYTIEVLEWPQSAGAGGGDVTGTLAAQETGDDTATASGSVAVEGPLSAQEAGADDFSASGTVSDPGLIGSLAAQETGDDTFAGTGEASVSGSLAALETGEDTASLTGTVPVTGALSAQEAGSDDFTASGTVSDPGLIGSLAAQEAGDDTATATGSVAVSGALLSQEAGADDFTAFGIVSDPGLIGSLSVQETGSDTFTSTASNPVSGVVAAQEAGADTLDASGTLPIEGAVAATEPAPDDFSATGSVSNTGALAAQEAGEDDFSASGIVAFPGSNGTLVAQETGADDFSGAGLVFWTPSTGAMAVREAGSDTAVFAASVIVTGALSVTEVGADEFEAFSTAPTPAELQPLRVLPNRVANIDKRAEVGGRAAPCPRTGLTRER